MARACGLLLNVLIAAAVLTFLALSQYGLIPNIAGGFYCNDPSITHTYNGDTVSVVTLLSVTYIAPLFTLWLVEACHASHRDYSLSRTGCVRTGARSMWRWYKEYLVGVTAVLFVVEAAKLLVGAPRPHFLDTCQPDMGTNCTTGGYVQTYTCTSTTGSTRHQKDSSKSFPSGHTALSVFTCIFMVWFAKCRISPYIASLLVPWLQGMCMLWALVCSFTRITDHRHHWWDVLAGFILGAVIAVYTVSAYCNKFMVSSTMEPRTINGVCSSTIKTHASAKGGHPWVRRLLSSTSSSQEEKEMREMPT